MLWVGLTGGIGSGKSTVADALRKRSVPVIDADQVARELVRPGEPALDQVVETFGPEVLHSDGTLDRAKLGAIVFQSEDKKQQLEQILHPRVQERVSLERQKLQESGEQLAIYDVPLLLEKDLKGFDLKVLVYCSPAQQVERVMKRNDVDEAEVRSRMAHQLPIDQKKKMVDYVIDNSGGLDQLQGEIQKMLAFLSSQKT